MIYTAARQKKQKTAGAIVPAVIFYARVPHPKANRRTTKTGETGTIHKKTHRYSEQFGNNLFIINKITKFADVV